MVVHTLDCALRATRACPTRTVATPKLLPAPVRLRPTVRAALEGEGRSSQLLLLALACAHERCEVLIVRQRWCPLAWLKLQRQLMLVGAAEGSPRRQLLDCVARCAVVVVWAVGRIVKMHLPTAIGSARLLLLL